MRDDVDQHAATELELYIKNDSQLHFSQEVPITKNLDFGEGRDWHAMFSVATRRAAAEKFARHFEVEAELGNYDYLLPKKYQKR